MEIVGGGSPTVGPHSSYPISHIVSHLSHHGPPAPFTFLCSRVLVCPLCPQVRGELGKLAEARLQHMESTLRARDEQLRQLQNSTWGAWAEDQAVTAEVGRLQAELSQSHTLHRQLASRLDESEAGRLAEGDEAASMHSQLRAALEGITHERDAATARVNVLAAEVSPPSEHRTRGLTPSELAWSPARSSLPLHGPHMFSPARVSLLRWRRRRRRATPKKGPSRRSPRRRIRCGTP